MDGSVCLKLISGHLSLTPRPHCPSRVQECSVAAVAFTSGQGTHRSTGGLQAEFEGESGTITLAYGKTHPWHSETCDAAASELDVNSPDPRNLESLVFRTEMTVILSTMEAQEGDKSPLIFPFRSPEPVSGCLSDKNWFVLLSDLCPDHRTNPAGVLLLWDVRWLNLCRNVLSPFFCTAPFI